MSDRSGSGATTEIWRTDNGKIAERHQSNTGATPEGLWSNTIATTERQRSDSGETAEQLRSNYRVTTKQLWTDYVVTLERQCCDSSGSELMMILAD